MFSLFFDGASRKNPGPASFGAVLFSPSGLEITTTSQYLGHTTNNVAEYNGLLYGLKMAINANVENLHVYGDSLLVINQVTHKWKINNLKLKEIHAQIIPLLSHFHTIQFSHVKRNLNKRADELANEALNKRNLM